MAASRFPTIPTTGMRGGLGRTLLTAFLLLAIGPLSLVGYVAFNQTRVERQRGTVERLTAAADLRGAQLRGWVQALAGSASRWAADPAASDALRTGDAAAQKKAREQLNTNVENEQAWLQVYLVSALDQTRWASVRTGLIQPAPENSPVWNGAACAPVHFGLTAKGESVFQFAAAVSDGDAKLLGCLVGLVRFDPSSMPMAVLGLGRTGVVYVANQDGVVLPLQGALPVLRLPERWPEGAVRAARQNQVGAATYTNVVGVPVVGAYRWLPDVRLALIAEQDQAEAFAASDELAAGFIGATLGVALFTAVIASVVTRQITRPIVLLTEAALKLSGGDLSARVQPARRDEIGILGGVFNRMAADLPDLYTGLERKVDERTRELQGAKEQIQYHAWQLSISAEIGRITTSILDLDTLLARASDLMRDAFQLEYVGVYLLEADVAVLEKSVGRAALPHERRLRPDSAHPVRWTISNHLAQVFTRPATSPSPQDEPRLVCYQLVLPLARGAQAIGALDLVSQDPSGFAASDQGVLQMLADQLSVAIENARRYSREHAAADEMREIDRLRGQFLIRMSHQFATYLNTIIGFSQLIIKGLDGPLNDLQLRDLTAVRHSGQQLLRLLDDILELANLEVGEVELVRAPVNPQGLVDELQSPLKSVLINPQLQLQTQVEPGLPLILADVSRLRQVLTNLVITAAEMSREGMIVVRAAHAEQCVRFSVSAPAAGARSEGDQGVSLALSRRLIELHDGRLRVEGREGCTVFEFTLPCV